MNKILAYTALAILLGTVTMLAPLALLGADGVNPAVVPPTLEATDQNRTAQDSQTLETGDCLTENWTETTPPNSSGNEYSITFKSCEDALDLSPIGFMVVPSFLVALGIFVILRKRMV